jgi:hypothetical protein
VNKLLVILSSLLSFLFFCVPASATTIITGYPFVFVNGTIADAGQVNSNFNQVMTQVNANAAGSGVNSDLTGITSLAAGSLNVPSLRFVSSSTFGLWYDATQPAIAVTNNLAVEGVAGGGLNTNIYLKQNSLQSSIGQDNSGNVTIAANAGLTLNAGNNINQIINTGGGNTANLFIKQGSNTAGAIFQSTNGDFTIFNQASAQNLLLATTSTGGIFASTNGSTRYGINGNGHITVSGPASIIGAGCGTSAFMFTGSNDSDGILQLGTGSTGTVCGVTFGTAYANTPVCVFSTSNTSSPMVIQNLSTTTLALQRIDGGTLTPNLLVTYHCRAINGS